MRVQHTSATLSSAQAPAALAQVAPVTTPLCTAQTRGQARSRYQSMLVTRLPALTHALQVSGDSMYCSSAETGSAKPISAMTRLNGSCWESPVGRAPRAPQGVSSTPDVHPCSGGRLCTVTCMIHRKKWTLLEAAAQQAGFAIAMMQSCNFQVLARDAGALGRYCNQDLVPMLTLNGAVAAGHTPQAFPAGGSIAASRCPPVFTCYGTVGPLCRHTKAARLQVGAVPRSLECALNRAQAASPVAC